MKCNNCGAENADGSRFCTSCGAALANDAVDTAAQQNAQFTQNVQYAQNMQYSQNAQYAQNSQYTQNAQYSQPMQNTPVYNGQNPQYMQYNQYVQGGQAGRKLTKEEFMNLPAMEKQKKSALSSAYICYFCAVITLIVGVVGGDFPIDAIILAVLGVIIHFKKSFIASVVLLAYSIFNFIVCIFLLGTVGGWLIIAAGVYAVMATNKINKAYKNYCNTGVFPTENVA